MNAAGRKRTETATMTAIAWMAIALVCFALGAADAGAETHDSPQSFDEAAAMQAAPAEASEERVIGRVTGVHGRVYAEALDGTRRRLVENAPIYPGDRLVTHRGAQLGVLSGDHYTGLNEETELSYALTPGGAPEVRLVRGHARVIEAGDAAAPAKLTTPALQIAEAGGDTEIYAFPEKAVLVSMVCALEGQVQAASTAGQSATVGEGGCAILKPAEGLYAAGGAGDALAPVGAAGPEGLAPMSLAGTAKHHLADPSAGPSSGLPVPNAMPAFDVDQQLVVACSTAATAGCGVVPPPPPNPPTNPPIPGLPPVPPVNPPSNPPIPGLPPIVP